MKRTSVVLTAIVILSMRSFLAAQGDLANVAIKAIHVSGPVYMLTGSGGNIGVSAGPDGLLIVDNQFAPLAPRIAAALKEIHPGQLKMVLNTHHHGDHTGGNGFFGQQAPIVSHQNARTRMGVKPGERRGDVATITFDQSLSLWINGEEIALSHAPHAHTDGDSVIRFTQSNVIHFGDTFFSGRFPNIDLGAGGSIDGYIRNVESWIEQAPPGAKLIPGHGPLSTLRELKEFREMLVETRAIVQTAVLSGKTLDEVKATGLPEKWKSWSVPSLPTSRWLEILYDGLKKP